MEKNKARRPRGAQRRESYVLTPEQMAALKELREPISVARAAEILGQSESSVYRAIADGRLRSVDYPWDHRTMRKLQGKDILEYAVSRPQRKRKQQG